MARGIELERSRFPADLQYHVEGLARRRRNQVCVGCHMAMEKDMQQVLNALAAIYLEDEDDEE